MLNKSIRIGSGKCYILPYSGTLPSYEALENEGNLIGYIKEGATIDYAAEYSDIKDLEDNTAATVVLSESATLNFSLITYNLMTLKYLSANGLFTSTTSAGKTTDQFLVGGSDNVNMQKYVIHFVHKDGKERVTIVGMSKSGFSVEYKSDKEALLSAMFSAYPMSDGRLIKYQQVTEGVTPSTNLDITANGVYQVSTYNTATVNITMPYDEVTLPTAYALSGYNYISNTGAVVTGTMADYSNTYLEATATVTSNSIQAIIANTGYVNNSYVNIPISLGSASPSDVKSGVTFSSGSGLTQIGTYVAPPDPTGSADENKVWYGYTFTNANGVFTGKHSPHFVANGAVTLSTSSAKEINCGFKPYFVMLSYFDSAGTQKGMSMASTDLWGFDNDSYQWSKGAGREFPYTGSGTDCIMNFTSNGFYASKVTNAQFTNVHWYAWK